MKANKVAIATFIMISSIISQCKLPRLSVPLTNYCICPFFWRSCSSPKILDEKCLCSCPLIACQGGQVVNPNTCQCECPTSCPEGQVLDVANCSCGCPNKAQTNCGLLKAFDDNTCACVCKQIFPCILPGFVLDSNSCLCVKNLSP